MRRRLRDAWTERDARERGVVLVFMGVVLFALVIMAGLAIDVANWWWTGQKLQKTADAAAMAGVTYLPDDPTNAFSTAKDTTKRNGYTDGSNATVTTEVDTRPTELRVTVKTEVDNFFTSIIGFKKTAIKRTAVADYTGSVPMGSPADYLGQDPEVSGRLQKLWLNISGRGSTKETGDRFASRACGDGNPDYYGCTGGYPDNDYNNNSEYLYDNAKTTNQGYRFVVRVESLSGDPLVFQVYDPAMIYVGDTCTVNMPTATEANNLQADYAGVAPYGSFFNDAATRYAPGGNDFCTGDQRINGKSDLNTAYIVREPDTTPWSDLDNPVVAGCVEEFRPINADVYQYLDPSQGSWNPGDPKYTDGAYVRANLHRWVTVCSISASNVKVGDYILQVRTNYSTDPLVFDPAVTTGGHNRFSIRAGFQASAGAVPGGSNVNVFANGKLPIYVNAAASSTPSFYLARVRPSAAGRTLRLEFFDIGDVGSGANQYVNMQVVPPPEYAATFSNCTFKRDDAAPQTSPTCTLTGLNSSNHQGRLESVTIPIPSTYTCDENLDTGCWIRILMTFGSAATPRDTTTWSASIDGDPIRLVE